jgi:threonine dehydrogenase-like Zn-dependent dehydrogenase
MDYIAVEIKNNKAKKTTKTLETLNADEALLRVYGCGVHKNYLGGDYVGICAQDGGNSGLVVNAKYAIDAIVPCGKCVMCQAGKTNLCDERIDLHNGFSQFVKIKGGPHVRYLLNHTTFDEALFIGPLARAIKAVRSANIKFGDRVLCNTASFPSILIAKLCKMNGASVDVLTSEERGNVVAPFLEVPIVLETKDKYDIVFIDDSDALTNVDMGSRVIISDGNIAIGPNELKLNLMISCVEGATFEDYNDAYALITMRKINFAGLITHMTTLKEVNKAISLLKEPSAIFTIVKTE